LVLSRGRFHFSVSLREEWHGEQTRVETLAAATGERGSFGARMLCSPWQSVHAGASLLPLRIAAPWTLAVNFRFSEGWQGAQTCWTRILLTKEDVSMPRRSSCAP